MQMVVPADPKVISIVTLAYPASRLHPKTIPARAQPASPARSYEGPK